MKLLNVFGLVVGAHLAALTFIFATPGCRSTGNPKPRPEQTLADGSVAPVAPVDSLTPVSALADADLNPGVADLSTASPVVPIDGGVRFAPSRPAVSAPVAPAAETAAPKATHTIVAGDSLWSISRKYGVSVGELASANQLAPSATLRLGQQVIVPALAASPGSAPDTDAANTYSVVSGDTLGGIARRQGTTVSALRAVNNLSGDALRVGQKLVIPGNATPLAASAGAPSAPVNLQAGSGTYTVIPGDTLGSIARRHGVKVGELAVLNTVTDPGKLRVGQVLRLPSTAKMPAAPAPAPAPSPVQAPAEPAPETVTPVEPPSTVEPMAVPVIRID